MRRLSGVEYVALLFSFLADSGIGWEEPECARDPHQNLIT